jgi:ATP-dependent DNA helicase RecG
MDLAGIGVGRLAGVGEKSLAALGDVGVTSLLDLVTFYPRRYLDRTNQRAIAELVESEQAMVLATVRTVATRRTRNGRSLVEVSLSDGSSDLRVSFFNQAWRSRQLQAGAQVVVFGKVERYMGKRQMTNPVVDLVGDRTGRIVAVYPQSDKAGISSWQVSTWISEALRRVTQFADPLPARIRESYGLAGRDWAFRQIHSPSSLGAATKARTRLAFDELLRLQLVLVMRKRALERSSMGIRHNVDGRLLERLRSGLPFSLTRAQESALADIVADMAGAYPMHRLLQGDVGSGKTLVALGALLTAIEGGHQGAVMVPTEVLAEQHHAAISEMLKGFTLPSSGTLTGERPVAVELISNRVGVAQRRRILSGLAGGTVDVVVGTHALLGEKVDFNSLGCVVIDEQHRFGVEQRAALRAKGPGEAVPDVLVMTATPIPRTAAMTVYGDLDTTVLDELPPGRRPITTVWARDPREESDVWQTVRSQASFGRQSYVVCPLVEESEKVASKSATAEWERLSAGELAGLRVGLLHGQMPVSDKHCVMEKFRSGELDVLVSTTVIEVGVDVPNATVMVIEDAARFGVAQLHQLRGRVGRGDDDSWCYLLGAAPAEETEQRLQALVASSDGFELAEVDLELRGEGTILGSRQKGSNDLKLASLRRDRELVAKAREVAFSLVDAGGSNPLSAHSELAAEIGLLLDEDDREFLFKS